ncbi:hypothetical protein ACVII1_000363 [Bradyrhizobium elkanii]
MSRHPPFFTPDSAGGDEPLGQCQRRLHNLAPPDRKPALCAIGTYQQSAAAIALDPDIGGCTRQHPRIAVIDCEAELGWKIKRGTGKPLLKLGRKRARLVGGSPERRHQNVALCLGIRVCVQQPELSEPVDQGRITFIADAADLEIGAAGQVDQAVAVSRRQLGDSRRLRGVQPSGARANAHHEAVAR